MIEAGGGHKAAAKALQAELESAYPDRFEVTALDFMAAVGETALDRSHKRSWSWLLRHPRVSYNGQRLVDGVVPPPLVNAALDLLLARFSRLASRFVREQAIDVAVAVHFMPLRALAAGAARGEHGVPVLGVDTELLDGNALWGERRMDELMVATESCRTDLLARGVPAARVTVTGYPLHPKYVRVARDPVAMRVGLGLEPGRLTAVHVAGGEGIGGQLEATVEAVARSAPDIQYVAVCGANRLLRERLEALARRTPDSAIRVEGFVENLEQYIVASDVVVGKAGPGVTAETLALGRPMVLTSFVSASERRNVAFCEERGAGWFRPRARDIVATLRRLERDPDALHEAQRRAAAAAPAAGSAAIAARIAARLGVGRGQARAVSDPR